MDRRDCLSCNVRRLIQFMSVPRLKAKWIWWAIAFSALAACVDLHYQWNTNEHATPVAEQDPYPCRSTLGIEDGWIGLASHEIAEGAKPKRGLVLAVHAPRVGGPVDFGDWFGDAAFRISPWILGLSALCFSWTRKWSVRTSRGSESRGGAE